MDSTFINEILVALKCGTTSILYKYICMQKEEDKKNVNLNFSFILHKKEEDKDSYELKSTF